MDSSTRRQLLADIATLYYKEKNTQQQIAKKVGYSRSAVSRMLTEAENEGVIEVSINYPLMRDSTLERRLKEKYHLEAAFVINVGQARDERTLQLVGRAGALYMEQNLHDDMVLGIGWGTSLFELVNALPFLPLSNVSVVQVIGASGSKCDARIDGPDLAALLASKLNASHQFLHSPLLLDSEAACRSMRSQKQIQDTLNLAYQADITLLGIGTIEVDPQFSSIFRTGFVNEKDIQDIKSKGGVGHFCGLVIDADGQVLDIDVNRRLLAADLNDIKSNGCTLVGVAAGSRKTKAINAVLNGGWLDVLVTDLSAVGSLAT